MAQENNEEENKSFGVESILKVLSILFVLAIYVVIFLKILILE